MARSKKIFISVCVLFFIGLVYLGYDIGKRTTFPGAKPPLKERLEKDLVHKSDSVDSIH